jgi:hypothetical protein
VLEFVRAQQEAAHDYRCVPVSGVIVLPGGMTLASQLGARTAALVPQLDNCLAATRGHINRFKQAAL